MLRTTSRAAWRVRQRWHGYRSVSSASDVVEQARDAATSRDFDRAVDLYTQALLLEPTNLALWVARASAQLHRGKQHLCFADLLSVISDAEKHPNPILRLNAQLLFATSTLACRGYVQAQKQLQELKQRIDDEYGAEDSAAGSGVGMLDAEAAVPIPSLRVAVRKLLARARQLEKEAQAAGELSPPDSGMHSPEQWAWLHMGYIDDPIGADAPARSTALDPGYFQQLFPEETGVVIRDAPQHGGLGVFTLDSLDCGDVVFVEAPLLAVSSRPDLCRSCLLASVSPGAALCSGCSANKDTVAVSWSAADLTEVQAAGRVGAHGRFALDSCIPHALLAARLCDLTQGQDSSAALLPDTFDRPHLRHLARMRDAPHPQAARELMPRIEGWLAMRRALDLPLSPRFDFQWYCEAVDLLEVNAVRFHISPEDAEDEPFPLNAGLFPRVSYINHACEPNVSLVPYVHDDSLFLACVAIKDIQAGEQVVLDYLRNDLQPDALTGEQRRHRLLGQYGFLCQCPRCSSTAPGKQEQDLE